MNSILKISGCLLLLMLCSCKSTDRQYDNINTSYRYYVIDTNSDVPDAYFKTFEEASTYEKEFAEYHDYVIVKIDKTYNVYNMGLLE